MEESLRNSGLTPTTVKNNVIKASNERGYETLRPFTTHRKAINKQYYPVGNF